mgnify:FL=1
MDWTECKKKGFIRSTQKDENLIDGLKKQSEKKHASYQMLELNTTTASSKISLLYDSMRELLEALAVTKGYKIYNHECYMSFLKEILKEHSLGEMFNELRKIRNNLNYYGEDVDLQEAKRILHDLEEIREKVKKLV